jgi:hypothetical protein
VLDEPEPLAPRDHTQAAFGLRFCAPRDGLPAFRRARVGSDADAVPGDPRTSTTWTRSARAMRSTAMLPTALVPRELAALEGRRWYQLMQAPGAPAIAEWTKRWTISSRSRSTTSCRRSSFWARRK